MSPRFPILALAFGLTVTFAACGGGDSGAGPSPVDPGPSAAGQDLSDRELTVQCEDDWDGLQCTAVLGRFSSSPRDVTGSANWSTSDSRIATVDATGFVTIRGSELIAVRAFYLALQAFETVAVEPREIPWQLRTFWGTVTDAQGGTPLSGVTIRILDGPHANRTVTTGPDGFYQMDKMGLTHSISVFAFQVRFSKPGYVAVDRTFSMSRDKSNELSLSLARP